MDGKKHWEILMTLLKYFFVVLMACGLFACDSYNDDGGIKGDPTTPPTSKTPGGQDYYLKVAVPAGTGTIVSTKAGIRTNRIAQAPKLAVAEKLTADAFSAQIIVPDTHQTEGYRYVGATISRDTFAEVDPGIYLVNIDGIPKVDVVIYVTVVVDGKTYKLQALLIKAGNRGDPVDVDTLTTAAVALFLDAAKGKDLLSLDPDAVASTLEQTKQFLQGLDDTLSPADMVALTEKTCAINLESQQQLDCGSHHLGGSDWKADRLQMSKRSPLTLTVNSVSKRNSSTATRIASASSIQRDKSALQKTRPARLPSVTSPTLQ